MKNTNDFYTRVYEVVAQIPIGRVTSYGAIAAFLGSKGSSRMIGWAMNNAFSAEHPIPAHRVVNRLGLLTGKAHFGSPNMMQQLLESEGITIVDNQIQSFNKFFWDPNVELK